MCRKGKADSMQEAEQLKVSKHQKGSRKDALSVLRLRFGVRGLGSENMNFGLDGQSAKSNLCSTCYVAPHIQLLMS